MSVGNVFDFSRVRLNQKQINVIGLATRHGIHQHFIRGQPGLNLFQRGIANTVSRSPFHVDGCKLVHQH